jgi:hypothetical protein
VKWFRNNVKHGSRLALFALVIQFVLSFGHFHGIAAQAAPAIQSGLTRAEPALSGAASEAAQKQQPANPDSDQQPADSCAICAVIALANTMLFATPPALLLPQAVEFLHLATEAEFVHLNSVRLAFHSRAPPRS